MTTFSTHHFVVGICGYPGSGKTTAANMLRGRWGAVTVDDGRPLRNSAIATFGLTEDDVSTQEGKAGRLPFGDGTVTVRKFLGDYGKFLEAMFGNQILPSLAISRANRQFVRPSLVLLPSLRMDQGQTVRALGGCVIAIRREGCQAVYDFDEYDHSQVDVFITNDGSLDDLRDRLDEAMRSVIQRETALKNGVSVRVAAHFLHNTLCTSGEYVAVPDWLIGTAAGGTVSHPVLIVYTSRQMTQKERSCVPDRLVGYPVEIRPMASPQPAEAR